MKSTLLYNIKKLIQVRSNDSTIIKGAELNTLPCLDNAFVLTDGAKIIDFGTMDHAPSMADEMIDCTGRMVFPTWCDSHTHLVFAATREGEFVDRINGLTYQEIAQKGGGILNSARRLQDRTEAELLEDALIRLEEVKQQGTGAIEIKSGYGLTLESELKMLRVIRRLKEVSDMEIKATFLGAHALPVPYKNNRGAYIDLIINEMLPLIAKEELADYIDVFCEKVAFSVAEMEQILEAGAKYGLTPKVHVNQFNCMGGIQAAVKHNALSVDHLEVVNEEEIACLQNSNTIPTLLPSAPFFLNDHYPPARQLIDANLPVTLATDYNPGSTPSGNMSFVIALACIKMKMLPNEAINAATLNGAYAMELNNKLGSITKGKLANLFITKPMDSIEFLPYSFGKCLVDKVMIKGSFC